MRLLEEGELPQIHSNGLLSLIEELRATEGTVRISDGVVNIKNTSDTVWRGQSEKQRTLEQNGVRVTMANYDGDLVFDITYRDSYEGYGQSGKASGHLTARGKDTEIVDIISTPTHPAYRLVAAALREALAIRKGEGVDGVVRGLRSKVTKALIPVKHETPRQGLGGSH